MFCHKRKFQFCYNDSETEIPCFAAICAENCIHGSCQVPGECVCHPGWFGPNCDQCMENPDCVHGRCVDHPFQCKCYDGYEGTCCEEPICSEGCLNVRVENIEILSKC